MDHYLPVNYFVAFFWGLAVLFGLIGLGRLAALAIGGQDAPQAGWGLHAVWGIAVYLFLGGWLAVFHACNARGITLILGVGLAAMLWTTVRAGWPTRASFAALPWAAWPAFALVALSFASSIGWQRNVNFRDDLGAYYDFCEKLLATGSFDQPFSWRRLASLGGHTLLQSSTIVQTSFCHAQMFEVGLCPVIFLGLIVGFRGGALLRNRLGVFLSLVAVTAPILRYNTASHYTGVILFMGLFVSLDYLERADRRRHWLIVIGAVATAFCTLRAQNLAAAGITLTLYWIIWWLRDRPSFRQFLIDGMWCCGALLFALLPWMIMSDRSNQSPLFPLFLGGHSAAFNPVGIEAGFHQKLKLVVEMVALTWLTPLLLCLLVLPSWKKGLAASAVTVSAVVTSVILAYGLGLAPDETTVPRYVQPLLLAAAFAALASGALVPRLRGAVWAVLAIILVTSFNRRRLELEARYQAFALVEKNYLLNQPEVQFKDFGSLQENRYVNQAQLIADYRSAQGLVPAGRKIMVVADYPFLFDHARNDLWNIDFPHAASPPPGLPYQKPAEETKRYLRHLGIEYFIYVDFNNKGSGAYDRTIWEAKTEVELYRIQRPFYLDFFDTVESLAASETVLGKVANFTVVQFRP